MKDTELNRVRAALDLVNEKLKPLVLKVAEFYDVEIGYDINWIIKENEGAKDGSRRAKASSDSES